jgi:carbonic anhydrase
MSHLDTLLERNETFSAAFDQGHLGIPPKLGTILLTCVDARVDPAHYFGLALGDCFVLRNAGARVNPAIITDIAILSFLARKLQGPGSSGPQVLIIPHTNCGMKNFSDPTARAELAAATGVDEEAIAAVAFTTPEEAVMDDIEKLRQSDLIDNGTVVGGYVYDVTTGKVVEVVAPVPLG